MGDMTAGTGSRQRGQRAYPPPHDPADPTGDSVALAATRALLGVESRADAALVVRTAVRDLGGEVVAARLAPPEAMQVDVSLGDGERTAVVVDRISSAAMRLAHHLPTLVHDALRTAARCDHSRRQAERAARDCLTGVASRAEVAARLSTARQGDVVCLLDLDGLKRLNDSGGHVAGDRALRSFGELLRRMVRGSDFSGRYGGDEFVVVLPRSPAATAVRRMRRVAGEWALAASGTGVSIGVAVVDARGALRACAAADRAMYRVKRSRLVGADRVAVADPAEYDDPAADDVLRLD